MYPTSERAGYFEALANAVPVRDVEEFTYSRPLHDSAVGAFVDVVSARRGQDDVALMFTSMFHKMASHLKTKKAPADVQNTCLQQVMHAVHGRLWWR